jgi:hypothetical protein
MTNIETYGDVALGVESAWPALVALPSLAIVAPAQIDAASAGFRGFAPAMPANRPVPAMGSL